MKLIKIALPAALLLLASGAAFASAQINITATNNTTTTVTPSNANYAGYVTPLPAQIIASQSQSYTNVGLGNVTSFHIDYSNTAGKKCHFDAASFNQSTPTSPCLYPVAAKSTGGTYATCTATITSVSSNPANCSFSVTFTIR
jgi:hypothetical protein